MNKIAVAAVAAVLLNVATVPVYAVDTHESHHTGTDAQKTYPVRGEIVTVDQEAGKAKIRHEAIAELGWSGMTMVFPAADRSLLKDLKPGDKVDFTIAKDPSSGQYTLQTLQVAQ